ncbi:MAG: acyl carrier protein [Terriglobia bacterium]|jgi:acyl carrier protein
MNRFDSDELRAFLLDYLAKRRASQGRDVPKELSDDCDLLLSGMVDSLGLLDLMTALQEHCGREIDFDGLDPEQMTIVGPLCDFVSAQMTKG